MSAINVNKSGSRTLSHPGINMDRSTFTLALSNLNLADILSCETVCRSWCRQTRGNRVLWKIFYQHLPFAPKLPDPLPQSIDLRTHCLEQRLRSLNLVANLYTSYEIAPFPTSPFHSYCSVEDDGRVYLGDAHGRIKILESTSKAKWRRFESWKGHGLPINFVHRGADGKMYTASADGTIKIWQSDSQGVQSCTATLPHGQSGVTTLQMGADGRIYSLTDNGLIHVWQCNPQGVWNCKTLPREADETPVFCLGINGKLYRATTSGHMRIWQENEKGAWQKCDSLIMMEKPQKIDAIQIGPDGLLYVSCKQGGILHILASDQKNQWEITQQLGDYIALFLIGKDGRLYTVHKEMHTVSIKVWKRGEQGWEELTTFATNNEEIQLLQLSTDGRLYAMRPSRKCTIYDFSVSKEGALWQIAKELSSEEPYISPWDCRAQWNKHTMGIDRVRDMPSTVSYPIYDALQQRKPPKANTPAISYYGEVAFCDWRENFLRKTDITHADRAQAIRDYLNTITWSVPAIGHALTRVHHEDAASREFLLDRFARLPTAQQNAVYASLSSNLFSKQNKKAQGWLGTFLHQQSVATKLAKGKATVTVLDSDQNDSKSAE